MGNHGYCINCWWYKTLISRHLDLTPNGIKEDLGNGRCYMHNAGNEDEYGNDYKIVTGDCYCPDYCNRARGNKELKMTLEEWIKRQD